MSVSFVSHLVSTLPFASTPRDCCFLLPPHTELPPPPPHRVSFVSLLPWPVRRLLLSFAPRSSARASFRLWRGPLRRLGTSLPRRSPSSPTPPCPSWATSRRRASPTLRGPSPTWVRRPARVPTASTCHLSMFDCEGVRALACGD
eukprot:6104123-Pleurochrysis_carterae.AAC.1